MSCPEYNSSITPLWKNTIDWVSRQAPGEGPLAAYKGKVATIMSASPGRLGGLRGLVHVRSILGNIGVAGAAGSDRRLRSARRVHGRRQASRTPRCTNRSRVWAAALAELLKKLK